MNNEEHRHKVILTNLGFAISLLIFFLAMNFSDTGTGGWIHQKFDSTFYGNQIADVCFATHTDELNYRTDVLMARHVQLMILDILYIAVSIKIGEPAMSRMSKSRQALSYLKY